MLLIAVQRPDATQVAGIRTWNSLGRHVNKGEHGIAILAPCVYRTDQRGTEHDGLKAEKDGSKPVEPTDDGPTPRSELRGFRVVHVFDVTQTDGTQLPDVQPQLLSGDAPVHLWDRLVGLVLHDGYRLERRTCPAGVNGWTAAVSKTVVVDKNLGPAQAFKTLVHELGHIRALHAHRFPEYGIDRICRGAAEVEAESIAYIVTSHLGMASDAYSVPYVASWADDLDVLRHHMSTVVTVAQGVVDDVERARSAVTTSPRGVTPTAAMSPQGFTEPGFKAASPGQATLCPAIDSGPARLAAGKARGLEPPSRDGTRCSCTLWTWVVP